MNGPHLRPVQWLRRVCLLALLLTASCAPKLPPDIVVIMTDDQRWDTLTATHMPATWARLVQNGVRFSNAFVTTALCCPSRISFLTGDLASVHGVQTNHGELSVGPDRDTLATRLHAAGYRTGLFGKYVNGYEQLGPPNRPSWYIPPGWDVWAAFASAENAYLGYTLVTGPTTTVDYGNTFADYSTDVLRERAEAFIDESARMGVPFLAFVAPFAPHTTSDLAAMVAERHQAVWANLPPWRVPSWAEDDISDKGTIVQQPITPGSIDMVDGFRRLQLESLLAVDELVEGLSRVLARRRIGHDTIVVFTSDNGFFWYEHRLTGKNMPYDEGHRVPLVVSYPAVLGLTTRTEDGLVTLQDVCASLAEWAGVPAPGREGMSFASRLPLGLPLLRTSVPIEGWRTDGALLYSGSRTATTKRFSWSTGEAEEYDLVADPYELHSLQ